MSWTPVGTWRWTLRTPAQPTKEPFMDKIFPLRSACASAFLVTLLAGCAAAGAGPHSRAGGGPGGGMQQGQMQDMQAMCEMHRKEMGSRTPQERQAMMEERMKSMTPEMRQRTQAMMEQCR
jgi:hypothetical protein